MIKIDKYVLNEFITDNEEIKKMYYNNPEFYKITRMLIDGVTEQQLLLIFVELLQTTDSVRTKLLGFYEKGRVEYIVATEEQIEKLKEQCIKK
jgi:hypothetical protein